MSRSLEKSTQEKYLGLWEGDIEPAFIDISFHFKGSGSDHSEICGVLWLPSGLYFLVPPNSVGSWTQEQGLGLKAILRARFSLDSNLMDAANLCLVLGELQEIILRYSKAESRPPSL